MPCIKNTLIEWYKYNFKILDFKALVDLGIIEIKKESHSESRDYAFVSWGVRPTFEDRGAYSSGLGKGQQI